MVVFGCAGGRRACVRGRGELVRSGALDGEAGAGEAAGAAVVGEAPLLHQPEHQRGGGGIGSRGQGEVRSPGGALWLV